MTSPNRHDQVGARSGVALPAAVCLILMIVALYYLAIDRTISERNHVLAYYYESVALDLAESGINLAAAKLQKRSSPVTAPLFVGAFRGLTGTIEVSVESLPEGRDAITSIGRLADHAGNVHYSSGVKVEFHLEPASGKRTARIKNWAEFDPPE